MQEGISYIAGCELPAVIVNIMRGGPGLGNIGPSQADYFQATRGGGHGDYHVIVLAPASVQELVDHVFLAFDLADRYRNPVMILGDGVLGQMVEPVEIPARRHARLPAKGWALTGCAGREPNKVRSLVLGDNELLAHNQKLQARYRQIAEAEMRQESFETDGAELLLVSYGTPSRTCRAALKGSGRGGTGSALQAGHALAVPGGGAAEAAKAARVVLVVEMSAGQLIEDVRLSSGGRRCRWSFSASRAAR